MKYLCLIYDEEKKMTEMSKADGDAFMGEYFAFTEGIKKSGQYVGGEALQPVQTATTVRVRNGKMSTTDGPFAETKEQLGGFYLITANDLDEALQIAAKIPSARIGSVEVRPVMDFSRNRPSPGTRSNGRETWMPSALQSHASSPRSSPARRLRPRRRSDAQRRFYSCWTISITQMSPRSSRHVK